MKTYHYLLRFEYKACGYIGDTKYFSVADEYLSTAELMSSKGEQLAYRLFKRVPYKTKRNYSIVPEAFEWRNKLTYLGIHGLGTDILSDNMDSMTSFEAKAKKLVEEHEAKAKS